MSEFADSIAIVFPADWPTPDTVLEGVNEKADPHCTLLWLGNISEASYTKEDVQAVLDRLQIRSPGSVATTGFELFGPKADILVTTLDPAKLLPVREALEIALAKIGAGNASEYKEYKPHVTLDYKATQTVEDAEANINVAELISLSAPVLWWGDER